LGEKARQKLASSCLHTLLSDSDWEKLLWYHNNHTVCCSKINVFLNLIYNALPKQLECPSFARRCLISYLYTIYKEFPYSIFSKKFLTQRIEKIIFSHCNIRKVKNLSTSWNIKLIISRPMLNCTISICAWDTQN